MQLRRRYKILIIVLLVVLVIFTGFIVWAETTPSPMKQAINALKSDSNVTVINGQWLTFKPTNANYSTGLIIYPGGRVDYRSYAPLAHAIANEGYLTVIVPMPLNLAVFGANAANDVIASHPEITSWAIGGHSLGGTMAAQFAYQNPSKIEGLVLWAAYPASGNNMSSYNLQVTTIHGSNDGLVSNAQIQSSLEMVPPTTVYVEIQGGNHAQFGYYGDQSGDNPGTITREAQQSQTLSATVELLQKLK
jgi:hypothetical protein